MCLVTFSFRWSFCFAVRAESDDMTEQIYTIFFLLLPHRLRDTLFEWREKAIFILREGGEPIGGVFFLNGIKSVEIAKQSFSGIDRSAEGKKTRESIFRSTVCCGVIHVLCHRENRWVGQHGNFLDTIGRSDDVFRLQQLTFSWTLIF